MNLECADYCSAFAILLASVKLEDDARDSSGLFNRILHRTFRRAVKKSNRYLDERFPRLRIDLNQQIENHLKMESGNFRVASVAEMETYSRPTATAFAILFSNFLRHAALDATAKDTESFYRIGYLLGAAIVSADCAFDIDRDNRTAAFNPLTSARHCQTAYEYTQQCLSEAGWLILGRCKKSTTSSSVIRHAFNKVSSRKRQLVSKPHEVSLVDSGIPWSINNVLAGRILRSRKGICDCGGCDCGGCDGGGCDCCGTDGGCLDGLCIPGDNSSDCCSGYHACNSGACCDGCVGHDSRTKSVGKSTHKSEVDAAEKNSSIGKIAIVTSTLRPFGAVELEGRDYSAKLMTGYADVGDSVVVTGETDFGLEVEAHEGEQST